MKLKKSSWLLYTALGTLFVLHNDFWLWNDSSIFLGLPVGLSYHFVFCLLVSFVMWLLARYAWPENLDSRE